MHKSWYLVIGFVLLITLATLSRLLRWMNRTDTTEDRTKEIERLTSQFEDAFNEADLDGMVEFYAEEYWESI